MNIEYYQKGVEAGQEAQNHHFLQTIVDEADSDGRVILPLGLPPSFPDRQFLTGYIAGLSTFFSSRDIKIPIGTSLSELAVLPALKGFIMGLGRKEPEPEEIVTTIRDADWSIAYQFITLHLLTEGYFIGFWASIIRDFSLPISHHEVPTNSIEYQLFIAGSRGAEIGIVDATSHLGQNWATEFNRGLSQSYLRMKYTGGLRVWLQQQALDAKLADQLTHPESLRAFQKTLEGEVVNETGLEPAGLIGHQLGKAARLDHQ